MESLLFKLRIINTQQRNLFEMTTRVLIIYQVINGDENRLYLANLDESRLKMMKLVHGRYDGCFHDKPVQEAFEYMDHEIDSGNWTKIDSNKMLDVEKMEGIDKIILTGFVL